VTYYSINFAPRTDGLSEDGQERYQTPYPFHVNPDRTIMGQEFWHGDPAKVIGFAQRLDVQSVDLSWKDFLDAPQKAVNMYVVTANLRDEWSTHLGAVSQVTVEP